MSATIINERYENTPIERLREHPRNPNIGDMDAISESIDANGFYGAVVAQVSTGYVLGGNHRLKAAITAGMPSIPVVWVDCSDEQALRIMLADNRTTRLGHDDPALLSDLLRELSETNDGLVGTAYDGEALSSLLAQLEGGHADTDQDGERQEAAIRTLADRFIVPPLSILDTRRGYWQARKQTWVDLGIRSEIGRGNDGDVSQDGLVFSMSAQSPQVYVRKNEYERQIGHAITWDEFAGLFPDMMLHGTSTFDPVLCEVGYRWFCPEGGSILDPFAGGSVRGLVAGHLGYRYTGVDLSERQVNANVANAGSVTTECAPLWIVGDSRNIRALASGEYDMIFSCPPYGNLEVYSDDPQDLSAADRDEFLQSYRHIIAEACEMLKPNRFAAFVVGNYRDSRGRLCDFAGDTVRAFEDAGLSYFNDAIIAKQVASAAIRAGYSFPRGRKLARVHEYMVVMVKGDPKAAHEACGAVEIDEDTLTAELTDTERELVDV
jgi:DNA modification methylase